MTKTDQSQSGQAYTGADNLEVMKDAINYNRYLLDLIRHHADGARTVIDFGAGSGTFAVPNASAGFDLVAVELDDALRAHLAGRGLRVAASTAELPAGSTDYAYTLNVLEHISDDVAALRALRVSLKPGARLLVYVPAFQILYTSMDEKVGHIRRYTRRSLRASVEAAGFAVERVAYADSIGFFATLAFKLADRGSGDINIRLLKIYDRLVFPLSRALDLLTHRWFGKNVVLVARNPA